MPPDEGNKVESCLANELDHVTYLDQSGHSKYTSHVNHKSKLN